MMKQSSSSQYRWLTCALLFLATTINYFDRQILSLVKPLLDTQLGWTNEQFGAVNSAFQAAYALALLGFGWLVHRYGARLGYALSIGAWSLAAIGHALVASIGGFFAARVALGLGEGGNFPSAITAIAGWFPQKERAFATALFNSGANVGAILAPAVVPWVALAWGWQAAFAAAGLVGLGWLMLWLALYREPSRSHAASSAAPVRIPLTRLLGYRQAWSFIAAKFLTDPIWWFFLIWLPDYFNKSRGLDLKKGWIYLVTIYSLVTVLSIIGGWLPGRLIRSGWDASRARKASMLLFAFCVLPIVFATSVNVWGAVLLIGLAGAAHQAWSANLYTTVSDLFPERAVAQLTGVGGMAGSVGGILFPLFSGYILDHVPAAGGATGGYAILFGICSVAYLVAFIVNHLLAPRFELVSIHSAASLDVAPEPLPTPAP